MTLTNSSERIISNERLSPLAIKEFMDREGISSREMSEIFGVSIQCVNFWIAGNREFSITNSRLIRLFKKYPQLIREF